MNKKDFVIHNFEERTQNMLKALFAVWANKKCVMSADLFYQKMTTFGLVPDLKFIEGITSVVYSNRPKILN